ncbi:MAG TPA: hypothetical protein VJW51_07115 [Candidatus Acidoferrales bacterium]|nr:hypothetical protein [Candidatus Acidoferrales bacterium]
MERDFIYQELQSELSSGESFAWAGQPSRKVVFHAQDLVLFPFSLLWGGFAIFWEAGVLGFVGPSHAKGNLALWPMALFGIPFVLIGQYLIWGRFLYTSWKKGKIFYAVTNKRVLVVDTGRGRKVTAAFLQQLPAIDKSVRRDGIGTITFGLVPVTYGRRSNVASWDGGLSSTVPTFVDVEDAESVYRIVSDLREKSLKKD